MLRSIGKFSKSFFIKLLVAIIILPFIFWGMGDVFRGGSTNIIATIDGDKISSQEFLNYVNKLNLSKNDIKNLSKTNLMENILSEFIGRKIINLEINDLGIEVSDKSLRDIIKNDKTFFKSDKFSRTEYEKFLLKSNLNAPLFEKNIVAQEKKRQLLSFLSSGVNIPYFLIKSEFNKENQSKTIKYIDLEKIYQIYAPEKKDIDLVFTENKDLFIQTFKSLSFVKLDPSNLVGGKDFNETFFNTINEIENYTLDGSSINEIVKQYSLVLKKLPELNINQTDQSGNRFDKIDKELFAKIFNIKEVKAPEVINFKNEYFLVEVSKTNKVKQSINNKNVSKMIISQLKLKNKFKNNSKISREIISGQFNFVSMQNYAKKNSVEIKQEIINDLKNNKKFSENMIKQIFLMKDGEVNLITDNLLKENFIIYSEKTKFKDFSRKDINYQKYKSKAKLNFSQEIYSVYDKDVNRKYKININKKTIDRIKNSL